jgi:hypothetical protein
MRCGRDEKPRKKKERHRIDIGSESRNQFVQETCKKI